MDTTNSVADDMYKKMRAGQLYIAQGERIKRLGEQAAERMSHYNTLGATSSGTRMAVLREMFALAGEGVTIRLPVYTDYGIHVRIGAGILLNHNCVLLDAVDITIGECCQLTPGIQFLTAWYPLEAEPRRAGWESDTPITIGDNVWLGANMLILPGMATGDNIMVGASSVATRDLPANVAVSGNPARVRRDLPGCTG